MANTVTERGRIAAGSHPGELGLAYAPFDPAGGGQLLNNLNLAVAARAAGRPQVAARQARHRQTLDRRQRQHRRASTASSGQALDMIVRGAGEAFDITQGRPPHASSATTRASFRVGKKLFQPSSLGQQMLMARRLVEAGCGFVTVQNSGWDMHADGNNPGIGPGMDMLGRPLDKAVSAFLDDLDQPRPARQSAAHHHGRLRPHADDQRPRRPRPLSQALHARLLRRRPGQRPDHRPIDPKNDAPASEPIRPANLLSTVLHALFDIGQMRLDPAVPRELARLAEPPPIDELF